MLILPDPEPLDQVFGALQFGVQTVLLPLEARHILHGDKYHLLLAERMFGFNLQLLHILVANLWTFSCAPALVGFCLEGI